MAKLFSLLVLLVLKASVEASDDGSQHNSINSQLLPPGSLGALSTNGFNVTGPLHSFVEQLQNSRSGEQPIIIDPNPQPPIVQMPTNPQGHGSVIYYGQNPIAVPVPPPQPPVQVVGPQNRPALDPALQQLLNSFNTNPEQNRNTFIQASQAPAGAPTVSYITCYVGCSHVTNIVTNEATPKYTPNFLSISLVTLIVSMVVLAL